jgi:hypothetical protein
VELGPGVGLLHRALRSPSTWKAHCITDSGTTGFDLPAKKLEPA